MSSASPKGSFAGRHYRALGRLRPGVMNKTETAYAAHLDVLAHAGEILWYRFEGIKLRLAASTFVTIDFAVLARNNELEMHEVKGHWEDDARVKMKLAADQYPFRFVAVKMRGKSAGGGWAIEEF